MLMDIVMKDINYCKKCGKKMETAYIECCIFDYCPNKECSEFSKWPKEFESTRLYLKECQKRGSFCKSETK